jgi:hypothetical protein
MTRQRPSGAADGVAVDDEFDATVALAASGVSLEATAVLAEAARDGRRSHALLARKSRTESRGARELLIEIIAADTVGMAFDLKRQAGMRENDAGNLRKLSRAPGPACNCRCQKDVRHVDDGPRADREFAKWNLIAKELRAKLSLFGFGCAAAWRALWVSARRRPGLSRRQRPQLVAATAAAAA